MVHGKNRLSIKICIFANKRKRICIGIKSVWRWGILNQLVHPIAKASQSSALGKFDKFYNRDTHLLRFRGSDYPIVANGFIKYLIVVSHANSIPFSV